MTFLFPRSQKHKKAIFDSIGLHKIIFLIISSDVGCVERERQSIPWRCLFADGSKTLSASDKSRCLITQSMEIIVTPWLRSAVMNLPLKRQRKPATQSNSYYAIIMFSAIVIMLCITLSTAAVFRERHRHTPVIFSHVHEFSPNDSYNYKSTTTHQLFLWLFVPVRWKFCDFHLCFWPSHTYKLQLQLHNLPFTTANHILQLQKLWKIYTIKYALTHTVAEDR